VLVRDLGDQFQIVLQPDHGAVGGQLAAAWTETAPIDGELATALILAAARHDDGWSVWERHPRLDDEGRPQIFHAVPRESLLSSYRACADIVCAESAAAGLLVSMHVSGLQRNRYGVMDDRGTTALESLNPPVREFVVAEEQRQSALVARLGCDERERWRAYWQLQLYDTISLYLGLADLAAGESSTIGPMAHEFRTRIGQDHGVEALTLTAGPEPWTVHCDPFPFGAAPLHVVMRRRLVPKSGCTDEPSFRAQFNAAAVEEVTIGLTS